MSRKLLIMVLSAIFILVLFGGCTAKNTSNNAVTGDEESNSGLVTGETDTIEFTDMEGRVVKLDHKPERLLIIGSSLRLYTYIAGTDGLVGVERAQQNMESGRPYILANPELAELPIVGEGFPNDPNPELIISVEPDIIIAGDIMDKDSLEALENNTGIPVVITKCGSDPVFDDITYEAMRVIGQATGNEARVEELISFMDQCENELSELTEDIPEADRPSVYVGGLSYKGTHGIDSTMGLSKLLMAINANNVVDEMGEGQFFIDKEKLVEWNPDILIIDQNGLAIVMEDYQENFQYYNALAAVKNGQVYGQLPYTSYYSNIETALADLYYIGSVLYPDNFKAIDPVQKADEIYNYMLGEPLYEKMAAQYGGFGAIRLGE